MLGKRWCQIGSPDAPEWVFAVYRGVVRAVYQIDEWVPPTEQDLADQPRLIRRVGFRGTRDRQMEDHYLYANVAAYATQNPVRYVHCGPDRAAMNLAKVGAVKAGPTATG